MHKVKFLGGVVRAQDVETLKLPIHPKVVFSGRSNVGKSSLLNSMTGFKVARVSAEPGKTREMNFFEWQTGKLPRDWWTLVDLPGYGYARVAQTLRKQWGQEITRWLKSDPGICLIVALVDGRHGFLENDIELVDFLIEHRLPFIVAFTKMDKWKSKGQRIGAEKKLAIFAEDLGVPEHVFVSTELSGGTRSLEAVLRQVRLDAAAAEKKGLN